jgi:spore maturation protein CgeB
MFMSTPLRLRFFAHSWRSDWNHGNAHFLRGLADELRKLGHEVRCYEPADAWSYVNLLKEPAARQSLEEFRAAFPELSLLSYSPDEFESLADTELRDADVVIVHEWSSPQLVNAIFAAKARYGFRLLFHDTHHRSYTSPHEIAKLRIPEFDGVLAFGEAIRHIYLDMFKARRAWTFHEAADTARFYPYADSQKSEVNWIGNWGDDERTRELQEFLIEPLAALRPLKAAVYGVRYPQPAKAQLEQAGIQYRGYLPNLSAPRVYSHSALTLHIPRRCYANGLSGIPTIRMFEAFACGVPLVCSPWTDLEGLFRPNQDFICVPDARAMAAEIAHLLRDETARRQLSRQALDTIQQRHTCLHRARQFEEICQELGR